MQGGKLFCQSFEVFFPITWLPKPGKTARKGGVGPPARQPGRVIYHTQRPKRLDQVQLRGVKRNKLLIALKQHVQLMSLAVCAAIEHHPKVLNGRRHAGVVKIHTMWARIGPQYIASMAVTVDPDR